MFSKPHSHQKEFNFLPLQIIDDYQSSSMFLDRIDFEFVSCKFVFMLFFNTSEMLNLKCSPVYKSVQHIEYVGTIWLHENNVINSVFIYQLIWYSVS